MSIAMATFECRGTGNVHGERLVHHSSGSECGPHHGENEGAPRMSSFPCPCLRADKLMSKAEGWPVALDGLRRRGAGRGTLQWGPSSAEGEAGPAGSGGGEGT